MLRKKKGFIKYCLQFLSAFRWLFVRETRVQLKVSREQRVRELRGLDTALIPSTLSENARRCLAAGFPHAVLRRALACRSCRYHTFSGMKSLRMKIVSDLLLVAVFFRSSMKQCRLNMPSATTATT